MLPKRALLRAARWTGLSMLARRATGAQLRILCYHGLWLAPGAPFGNCLFMTPDRFAARMARLARSGLPVLPLGEAVERLAANRLPRAAVVITIDDGWASTHSHMLPVLERQRLPATLYATTWYAGRDLPVVNVAVDYLIANRDRHGANIEVLVARDGSFRLAPIFDCGLSLVFSCFGDEEQVRAFDPMRDVVANNYLGTRSLEENLAFVRPESIGGWSLDQDDLDDITRGIDLALPPAHVKKIREIIWERWVHLEALRDH